MPKVKFPEGFARVSKLKISKKKPLASYGGDRIAVCPLLSAEYSISSLSTQHTYLIKLIIAFCNRRIIMVSYSFLG
jgi:hypothetical protein